LETRRILRILARGAHGGLINVPEAGELLHLSRQAVASRLAALARQGWIKRVRRGLYLVLPLEADPRGSVAMEDPWVLASALFAPCYIGGWSAAEHWGLTEQLFRSTFVVTAASARRRRQQVLGTEFAVVRVQQERITGLAQVWRGSERVAVSSPERTIVDALIDPSWVGGVRHLVEILATYQDTPTFSLPKILKELKATGRGSAVKRLGYLTESLWGLTGSAAEKLRHRRTAGTIRLDPAVRSKGKLNKRWGLWVNVSLPAVPGRSA
jgi:predicted transcriptional regulator of viral defense system